MGKAVSTDRYSGVSFNMLVDALEPYEIVHSPSDTAMSFRWVSSYHWLEIESSFFPEDTLFICRPRVSVELHEERPDAFSIIVTDGEIPDWVADDPEKALVIKSAGKKSVLQRLQDFFLSIQAWQGDIEHLLLTRAPLNEILTLSYPILHAPLVAVDPETGAYAQSAQSSSAGFWEQMPDIIGMLQGRAIGSFEFKGADSRSYVCLFNSIYPDGIKPHYILAIYNAEKMTLGRSDLFKIFHDRLMVKYGRHSIGGTGRGNDKALFPGGLIAGKYISNAAIQNEFEPYGIKPDSEFRLLSIDLSSTDSTDTCLLPADFVEPTPIVNQA